jgi:hypothetical protein
MIDINKNIVKHILMRLNEGISRKDIMLELRKEGCDDKEVTRAIMWVEYASAEQKDSKKIEEGPLKLTGEMMVEGYEKKSSFKMNFVTGVVVVVLCLSFLLSIFGGK